MEDGSIGKWVICVGMVVLIGVVIVMIRMFNLCYDGNGLVCELKVEDGGLGLLFFKSS